MAKNDTLTVKNQGCKRGCRFPVYSKTDRYGDEDTYCLGCDRPTSECVCVKRKIQKVRGNNGKQ
jgi:hypothetical protein